MQRHESTVFDPQQMRPSDLYHLLNAVVVPTYASLVATGNVHLNGQKTRA
jgi:poly(A) polymerase Pap1